MFTCLRLIMGHAFLHQYLLVEIKHMPAERILPPFGANPYVGGRCIMEQGLQTGGDSIRRE